MHAMLDLETTGLRATSAILSIGAVWFDPLGEDVMPDGEDRIHIKLDWAHQLAMGLTKDESTLEWWRQQDKRAYEEAWEGQRTHIMLGLGQIRGFLMRHPLDGLWGNGAAFDNAVIRHVMDKYGVGHLWTSYKLDRCYRTLRALYPDLFLPEFEGVEHNALHDAIYQARCAQVMLRKHHELTSLLSKDG